MAEVKVKYKDENFVYDTDRPDDLERIQHYMGQGMLYDREKQSELGELRKKAELAEEYSEKAKAFDNFNARLIQIAQGDESEKERFVADLEKVGIELTQKQKDTLDDMADPEVKSLKSEVADLKKQLTQQRQDNERRYERQLANQIESELNTLAQKYSSYEGYPEFDKDKVLDFANKNGLTDYENAYFLLHKDDIIEAEKKKILKGEKDLKDKRKSAHTEGGGEQPPDVPEIPKNYDDAVRIALQRAKQSGTKIILDD